jgi:hypothetical protein
MKHAVSFICLVLAMSFLPLTGISRDGTLPVNMDGTATDPVNHSQKVAAIVAFDDQDLHDQLADVVCKLPGTQVARDLAGGSLKVGNNEFRIIGTCKNGSNYEVVLVNALDPSNKTSLTGIVEDHGSVIKFKGTIVLGNKTYNFDLK